MVTLKNPFETLDPEQARLPRPAMEGSPYQERLDHDLREAIRGAIGRGRGAVLIVGARWPELAFELARAGRFVTLVDQDLERMMQLRARSTEEGLSTRLNLETRSYGEVSFEAGAFEVIVFYDAFDYLAAPRALFKKVRREMRAGGELILRTLLSAGAPFPDGKARDGLTVSAVEVPEVDPEGERWLRIRDGVLKTAYGVLGRLHLLDPQASARHAAGELGSPESRGPSWTELAEALSENFVVSDVQARQFLSFEVAELAAAARPWLGRPLSALLDGAARLDARLLAKPALRPLAATVLVRASKERELGRVFTLER